MISGMDLNATVDFTLPNDKENPTIWKLGIIPSSIIGKVSEEAASKPIESAFRLLQLGLRGWENFSVPFSTEKEKIGNKELDIVPLALLERIPLDVVSALSFKLMEVNHLTTEERKN